MAEHELTGPELMFLSAYALLDPRDKESCLDAYREAFPAKAGDADSAIKGRISRLKNSVIGAAFLRSEREKLRRELNRAMHSVADHTLRIAELDQDLDELRRVKAIEWLHNGDEQPASGQSKLLDSAGKVLDGKRVAGMDVPESAERREKRMAELERQVVQGDVARA